MPSTQQQADDTVWAAMKEGFISGGIAAIPSSLAGEPTIYVHLVDA